MERCLQALRRARTSPSEGRLVSAYRRSAGQCATWTRGITRRRGVEARPRPGQPDRQGPYPERKATRYSTKLHRYEVHTCLITRDHVVPRRTDLSNLQAINPPVKPTS